MRPGAVLTRGPLSSTLLTHLYSYFGAALGCSNYSDMGFPAYSGGASMYQVHK